MNIIGNIPIIIPTRMDKEKNCKIEVIYPNGERDCQNVVADTYRKAISFMGLEAVRGLGKTRNSINIVSTREEMENSTGKKENRAISLLGRSSELGICTQFKTEDKYNLLVEVNEALKKGLIIHLLTPEEAKMALVDQRDVSTPSIRVIGVGGAGVKFAGEIYKREISGIDVAVCDTDSSELEKSPVPVKLFIGANLTSEEQTESDTMSGRQCAEENEKVIKDLFQESPKVIVIVAGMGNGTGTGASPVLARIAKEGRKLILACLTLPFLYEGQYKIMRALAGCQETSEYADSRIILNNEALNDKSQPIDPAETMKPIVDLLVKVLVRLSEQASSGNPDKVKDIFTEINENRLEL